MKIKYKSKPTPHLLLTDIFEDGQLDAISAEIQRLVPLMDGPEATGSAGVIGNARKRNLGCWPHIIYQDERASPSLCAIREVFDTLKLVKPWKNQALETVWQSCNDVSILLSTYGPNDEYKSHFDHSIFTGLFWFRNEPDDFDGGDLTLSDYDLTVPCKNNTGMIFLGREYHEVSPVVPHDESFGGRHVFSLFIGCRTNM